MNTTGWTFISVQNQEIDVFGYWFLAPISIGWGWP